MKLTDEEIGAVLSEVAVEPQACLGCTIGYTGTEVPGDPDAVNREDGEWGANVKAAPPWVPARPGLLPYGVELSL